MANRERLLTLAAFLKELPENKWDFRTWVTSAEDGCGTICCAIGWCPSVFPNEWRWIANNVGKLRPSLSGHAYISTGRSGVEFFNISYVDFDDLFCDSNSPYYFKEHVTNFDVANAIEKYLTNLKES